MLTSNPIACVFTQLKVLSTVLITHITYVIMENALRVINSVILQLTALMVAMNKTVISKLQTIYEWAQCTFYQHYIIVDNDIHNCLQ